jgi:tRNA (adenine57-N1/adenine58-N1)-methyltransferase
VIESGTGSGSLSCSLASAVGTKGNLFSYEFNKERALNGKELFAKLKLS